MRDKRYLKAIPLVAGLIVFALLASCSQTLDPDGIAVQNEPPDTHLSGRAPQPLETGFTVHFAWSGRDPDSEVRGYEWKLVHVGADGLSEADSVTVDVLTGEIINPWTFTTDIERTFFVEYVESLGQESTPAQIFVLLLRAVDQQGAADPTPAYVYFTPSTLLPSVIVDFPPGFSGYQDARPMPPDVTFGWIGVDPDFNPDLPTKVRFLWKSGYWDNYYVRTKYEFQILVEDLVSFADSAWSPWIPYAQDPLERRVTFVNVPAYDGEGHQMTYFFAVQVMDTTGSVSVDRSYGYNVQNVYITDSLTPLLTVHETHLGVEEATGIHSMVAYDIAAGQPLNFSWIATADHYGGEVVAYQYGWDVTDPADENDPGWAVAPGNTPQHRYAPTRTFSSGIHNLIIQAWDNIDQLTRITYILEVIPIPDPASQHPLLLVDDVVDHNSNAWPDQSGSVPLDNDVFRDVFWEDALSGPGGVLDFNLGRDVIDTEAEPISLRDLVDYRAVIWTTRFATINAIWQYFKPYPDGSAPFNWLGAYQEYVGNLLLAGDRALNSFIEEKNWMVPWIFDTDEEILEIGGQFFYVGFGSREMPDGTVVPIGPERYPYRSMGIAMLDHITPRYHMYGLVGSGSVGNSARSAACAGVKALVLDPQFAVSYPIGGAFPDTIYTEVGIDWKDDLFPGYSDSLKTWPWSSDELYDGNISDRTTPWSPQMCDATPCVEPMFRIYSRYDWVDDRHLDAGDPDWPLNIFTPQELELHCGQHSLDVGMNRTVTTDHVLGFFSHKNVATIPSGKANVMWGFDPYRFDHDDMTDAVRWVIGEHFGLIMQP